MNRKYIITTAVGLSVIAVAAGTWALSREEAPVSIVPENMTVAALKEQIKDPDRMMTTMSTMWDRRDELTEEQRREVRRNMGQVMRDTMRANMDEYFGAETEEDKLAILDRHIDEMQEWMKRFEEMRKQREAEREANGEDAEAERERWRRERANQSTEERKERSEGRSPDQMVRMMTYFGAVRSRAETRGIEMPRWGPGGRGGSGRGGRGG